MLAYIRAYIHTYLHTYLPYIHPYTHTYIHTYIVVCTSNTSSSCNAKPYSLSPAATPRTVAKITPAMVLRATAA